VLRPVIEIGIKYRRRSLRYDVLVDSGADINVFNAELAEALGIDLATGASAEVTGATGQVEIVSIHTITLTVGDRSYKTPVAFLASTSPYGLVGQRGF
jgi:predicted aspartyl protease